MYYKNEQSSTCFLYQVSPSWATTPPTNSGRNRSTRTHQAHRLTAPRSKEHGLIALFTCPSGLVVASVPRTFGNIESLDRELTRSTDSSGQDEVLDYTFPGQLPHTHLPHNLQWWHRRHHRNGRPQRIQVPVLTIRYPDGWHEMLRPSARRILVVVLRQMWQSLQRSMGVIRGLIAGGINRERGGTPIL